MDGLRISLEPGGQFELSGAPVVSVHETSAEVNRHLYEVKSVAEDLGMGFAGMGFDPKWPLEARPQMPKTTYEVTDAYVLRMSGKPGMDIMSRTCTAQVNLDFGSESYDMINKLRVGLSIQPIAMALFASSSFTEGKPNGYLSHRGILFGMETTLDLDITLDWTNKKREMLREEVPRHGLQVPFRDGLLKHAAQDIFKIAKDGLVRRGFNEAVFLDPIEEVATTCVTWAERLLNVYEGKWGRNIDPIFDKLRL